MPDAHADRSDVGHGGEHQVSTLPGASPAAIPLVLQPLSNNVSFRDQAYAALKQAIMDADI